MDKLVALGVIILLIILGPLLGIWVINTLFDVQNPYDFWHWLAVALSGFAFGFKGSNSSSS